MINPADNILYDREQRMQYITRLQTVGKTVVVLKANIPGQDKRIKEANVLLGLISAVLPFTEIASVHRLDGTDGPCVIYVLNDPDAKKIKQQSMQIEDETPLGRFIDLDVYGFDRSANNRKDLRKCYLCNQPAFVCSRNHTHSVAELLQFIRNSVRQQIKILCQSIISDAIDDELKLNPKFGLVTPIDAGSHPDMDFHLMIKAKAAIINPLTLMFLEGYDATDYTDLFLRVRKIGYDAEETMMKATNNINAYKGLIFSLGLVVTACGYVIGHALSFSTIFDSVRIMTANIMDELTMEKGSFGLEAWKRYGFGGARQEAFLGFPTVQKALPQLKDFSQESLTMVLIKIISNCEDTVLLKRCGSLENYHIAKRKLASITRYDEQTICEVTDWCITRKISFGGSADLLVVTCFLKRIQKVYRFA
ncbi:MAG: triphosphoribosyl-dephospho-CoA synthase [Candidatus Izemoplasmatales bacterium]|nr:triphosphoribosyl-dephospho-CoA synthase [Candidatus Izemoplasmatales bacterium]